MSTPSLDTHPVTTREEWLTARKVLLEQEKAVTRELDALRAARRNLPWVRLEKRYVFDTSEGQKTLADLFDGRSQLAVYHFMLPPDQDHICEGCSFISDHIDAARQHFEQADLSFVAVSRATLPRIEEVKRRMGWRFRWVSSNRNDFNRDFGVTFTQAEIDAGATYNFGGTPAWPGEAHGISIFALRNGSVFHTYSSYARGNELMIGAFNWLDLAPKGRNEDGIMSWLRLHDEYEPRPRSAA